MAKAISGLHVPHDQARITLNPKHRTVLIESMLFDEQEVYDALSAISTDNRAPFTRRALRVGLIALKDVSTAEKIDYVQREFDRLKEELENIFTDQLGHKGMKGELDRIFGESGQLHLTLEKIFGEDGKLMRDIFDPASEATPVGRLRKSIEACFNGKDSVVYGMLDPHKEDSPLYRLRSEIMKELGDIKTDLNKYLVKKELVQETPKKGFEFEDRLEGFLQQITRPFNDLVERVSKQSGKSGNLRGDFTITVNDPAVAATGMRIVVEAKAGEQGIPITSKGLLGYLDDAMSNRDAQFAVAVSETPLQEKVGRYREYEDNKILCEFSEDGLPVEVAYRVARVRLILSRHKETGKVDVAKVNAKIDEVKAHLDLIHGIKARLTNISTASELVKKELDQLRDKVIASLEEMTQALAAQHPSTT